MTGLNSDIHSVHSLYNSTRKQNAAVLMAGVLCERKLKESAKFLSIVSFAAEKWTYTVFPLVSHGWFYWLQGWKIICSQFKNGQFYERERERERILLFYVIIYQLLCLRSWTIPAVNWWFENYMLHLFKSVCVCVCVCVHAHTHLRACILLITVMHIWIHCVCVCVCVFV